MTRVHEKDIKRFIIHIMRIYGKGSLPNWSENGLREQGRRLAWSFMVVRD